MAVNDVYRLTIQGQAQENFVMNSLYFKVLTDPGETPLGTADDLVKGFNTAVMASYLACLASDYLLLGLQAKRVSYGGGPQYIYNLEGMTGSASGTTDFSIAGGLITAPYQDPVSMKWRRVKLTLPGAPEGYVQQNRPTSAYLTAMSAVAALLASPIAGGGGSGAYQFCTWKRKHPLNTSVVIAVVTVVPSGHVGVQRKRERPQV